MNVTQVTQPNREAISLMQTEGGLQKMELLYIVGFTTANLAAWGFSDDEILDFWDDVNQNWRDSGMTKAQYIDRERSFARKYRCRL